MYVKTNVYVNEKVKQVLTSLTDIYTNKNTDQVLNKFTDLNL